MKRRHRQHLFSASTCPGGVKCPLDGHARVKASDPERFPARDRRRLDEARQRLAAYLSIG